MLKLTQNKLMEAIKASNKLYFRLALIVGPANMYRKQALYLDFTEILFDVSLKQDPLALLKRMSRNRTI